MPVEHFARVVEKPWGCELIWAETDRYVGKILRIKDGAALSLQFHEVKDETVMLISGLVEITYYKEGEMLVTRQLEIGEPFRIKPGLRHRFRAFADSDLLEVSTPELDDVVRLDDLYGRVPGTIRGDGV